VYSEYLDQMGGGGNPCRTGSDEVMVKQCRTRSDAPFRPATGHHQTFCHKRDGVEPIVILHHFSSFCALLPKGSKPLSQTNVLLLGKITEFVDVISVISWHCPLSAMKTGIL
jgi:hypothetical protein